MSKYEKKISLVKIANLINMQKCDIVENFESVNKNKSMYFGMNQTAWFAKLLPKRLLNAGF